MASTAVDLADLVPDLEIELSLPGVDAYPTVSEEEWVNRLRNAFWYVVLDGLIVGYEDSDGIITPISANGTALPRDMQQLIIMYTSINVIRNKLMDLKTVFRAKAGSTEYETQQAASVLTAILDQFAQRQKYLVDRIAEGNGPARETYYFDGFNLRQEAINRGFTNWVGA